MARKARGLGDFGEAHFGGAVLGDKRRTKRLVELANCMVMHPDGSLPDKLRDPSMYQACYRLFRCPDVTHAAVLAPHSQRARELMENCTDPVLVIHDTTELDYTSRKKLRDQLGQIGDGGGRGYECHNSLAVNAITGETLGVISQILHRRAKVPKNERVAKKREREDRESRLWVRGSQAVGDPPPGRLWIDICDRGADTFEYLDDMHARRRAYVVRSQHNRAIAIGHKPITDDGSVKPHYLHDHAREQTAIGEKAVTVGSQDGTPGRTAKCMVSCCKVQLLCPHVKRGEHRTDPLAVSVIRVWEVDAPAHVDKPLEWFLITNLPIKAVKDCLNCVDYYQKRWTIEELHKAMKTGCSVEKMQFDSVDRLEPAIAIYTVIAQTLVNLRDQARAPDADKIPATNCVPKVMVAVLSVWRYKKRSVSMSVHEFCQALARLGGHMNRKQDGPPGWLTLWRGWTDLNQMVDYAIKSGMENCD